MAKILLVEDDNNLREIYEARLQAEGYTIVSAQDGEDALVKAKQERPDLVISDVMMPRISGFEMLDILRNTEGLKQTKVIMLTALGQSEDKTRADALGADRYLVKSQVTLEDIVKAADELLNGDQTAVQPPQPQAAAQPEVAAVAPTPMPVQPAPEATAPLHTPAQQLANPAATPVTAPPTAPSGTPAPSTPAPVAPTPTAATTPAVSASAATHSVNTPDTQNAATAQPSAASMPTATDVSAPQPSVPETPHIAPTNTMPTTPVPTPVNSSVAAPAATPITPPSAAPVGEALSTPAVATPTVAPVPAGTPAVEKKVSQAPSPHAADDDKLVADAVKQLTETLSTEAEEKTKAPAEKPVITPPSATAPVVATPAVQPPATPTAPVGETLSTPSVATPTATAPPVTAVPAEPTPPLPPILTDAPHETSEPTIQSIAAPVVETETPSTTPETAETTAAVPTVAPESEKSSPNDDTETTTDSGTDTPQAQDDKDTPSSPKLDAPSAADEQALMQKQIDSFINEQEAHAETDASKPESATEDGAPSTASPETTDSASTADSVVVPAPALEQTLDSSPPQTPAAPSAAETTPPAPETIQPTVVPPEPTTETAADDSVSDDINIAHKKTIQPPVEPLTNKPDLNELLAKEGISADDHEGSNEPLHSGFTTPHQPGHVISPNGTSQTADDPNNIAL